MNSETMTPPASHSAASAGQVELPLTSNNLSAMQQPVPLVLLHGWGSDQRSWSPLLPHLSTHYQVISVDLPGFGREAACAEVDDFLNRLVERLPTQFIVLGWSLGGMLATRLAARFPGRVRALITLASNLCFVARKDWPEAMPAPTFELFAQSYVDHEELTLKRFAGLMAKGDRAEKALLKSLRVCSQESRQQVETPWYDGLSWLQQLDNREAFAGLTLPGLHLLAAEDALVPAAVASEFSSLNRDQTVEVMSAAAHALHWSRPELVAERIHRFLMPVLAEGDHSGIHNSAVIGPPENTIDKRKVAQSFGKAARQYDSVAQLQRRIGERLLTDLDQSSHAAGVCLDLGCGTGHCMPLLGQRCQQVIGLDLAQGMLSFAREKHGNEFIWLCGDAENLPLASASLNAVFSSLAIQWCSDLPALFRELQRVVKPGGRIYLATLGPNTLCELRQAWSQVDDYDHVNQFAAEQEIRMAVDSAGLQVVNWRTEAIVLRYRELRELTYELKTLGAHNMNQGQNTGLSGRQRISRFRQAYEQFRDPQQWLPATYEVFYLELQAD